MKITRIDLLRHGEAAGGNYFRGSTDDPLTPKGWQQMHQALKGQQHWDVVYSSPLSRCLEFAQQIKDQQKLPLTVFPEIAEIEFGEWEGKSAEQIEQIEPGKLQQFYENPEENTPERAESLEKFSQRISFAWQQMITENPGQRILVITHAGVIRMIFSRVLEIPVSNSFRIQINHGSLSRFQNYSSEDSDYCQLIFHNNQ